MTAEDKTLLLVEDDRPLRVERRRTRGASPRDQRKTASAT